MIVKLSFESQMKNVIFSNITKDIVSWNHEVGDAGCRLYYNKGIQ